MIRAGIVSGVGLLLGIITSFMLGAKYKWSWINSLIAAIAVFVLLRIFPGNPLTAVFGYKNTLINNFIIQQSLFALAYLIMAALLFFSPRIISWINNEITNSEEFEFESDTEGETNGPVRG